jgi:hypothetical protein
MNTEQVNILNIHNYGLNMKLTYAITEKKLRSAYSG